jgi:plasmid maintenance system antidote protein VapI
MTDTHGQPEQGEAQNHRTAPDIQPAVQLMSLNTQQAAAQLGVERRTIRRYIAEGIRTTGGAVLRLEARQVRSSRGPEWQIYQHDLENFKRERDHAATEGSAAGPLTATQPESQALTTSITLIATELERRSVLLAQAQETIERLAREAGQSAGRNEVLERELAASRQRVADLEQERDQWQQQTQKLLPTRPPARRIRLLPWQPREQEE